MELLNANYFIRKVKRIPSKILRTLHLPDITQYKSNRTLFPAVFEPADPTIFHDKKVAFSQLSFPDNIQKNRKHQLQSTLCTKEQLTSPAFAYWARSLKERLSMHRKLWEFCYVLQALYERDCLMPGKRGLGFAVGQEPLPSLMAKMGCQVVATDLDVNDSRANQWAETNQLTSSLSLLNNRGICNSETFAKSVSYRPVDMNKIPEDLKDFDYTWSSCSFEHCGNIELGLRFVLEQMKCLKPGGVAVHTTEFNLTSNTDTVEEGPTVIFRRQDIEKLIVELKQRGHHVEPLCLNPGRSKEDRHVDVFPYAQNPHLKLNLFNLYSSTSIGLIIRKAGK